MLHIPLNILHEWLGISSEDSSPTFYRVLGLTNLESDQGVIEFVSSWRIAFVETKRKGPDAEVAQELLGRMKAALQILLDAERKPIYDADLQSSDPQLQSPPPLNPSDDVRRWLGVVSDSAVPDDRRLLGINDTETDPAVIKTQFDQRMSMLRDLEKAYTDNEQVRVQRLVSMLAKAERRVVKLLKNRDETTKPEVTSATQATAIANSLTQEFSASPPRFIAFETKATGDSSLPRAPATQSWQTLRLLAFGGAAVCAAALVTILAFRNTDQRQRDRKSGELASRDSKEQVSDLSVTKDEEMKLSVAQNESTFSAPNVPGEDVMEPESPYGVPENTQANSTGSRPGTEAAENESGIAHLQQVLLSNTWHYRDSNFPPGGEEFRFNANGTFHHWNWNYWVVGPREIRVQYTRSNKDSATGVLFRFNADLSRFESPEWKDTRDRSGKTVRITGWRHEIRKESMAQQAAAAAAATAAKPETSTIVSPESFLGKELLANGRFENGTSNRRTSTDINDWTVESGSPFVAYSIPFYRLVKSNLNGNSKEKIEKYPVDAIEGRKFLVAVGIATTAKYEVSQDVDLGVFSKMIASGSLVLASTAKFRSYQLGKEGNPPKIIGPDTAQILLEFRSSKNGQALSGGSDSGNKQSAEWDDLSVSAVVPQNATWVRVRLIGRSRTKYAIGVLFDDVSLKASLQ